MFIDRPYTIHQPPHLTHPHPPPPRPFFPGHTTAHTRLGTVSPTSALPRLADMPPPSPRGTSPLAGGVQSADTFSVFPPAGPDAGAFPRAEGGRARAAGVGRVAAKRGRGDGGGRRGTPVYISVEADGSDAWRLQPVIDMLRDGAVSCL
jgi:hypothetical protein